jgi:putative transposase
MTCREGSTVGALEPLRRPGWRPNTASIAGPFELGLRHCRSLGTVSRSDASFPQRAPGSRGRRGPLCTARREQGGAKRLLLCEAAGVPIGLAHDGANRHDSKLLAPTRDSVPIRRPEPSAENPQGLFLDGGYAYPWVYELAAGRGHSAHIRRRADELELKRTIPGWRARRWVIEACHSWLNPNRSLLIRWSKKPENHLALLQLACGLIAFTKARAARLAHALPG